MLRRSNICFAKLTTAEINNCIRALGPKLYFEKQEKYHMGTVEAYLQGCTLTLPDKTVIKSPTAADIGTAPGNKGSLTLVDKTLMKGDLSSAVGLVHARQPNNDYTDLQFWLFYPYNGSGTVKVQFGGFKPLLLKRFGQVDKSFGLSPFGEHYGDWEGIILRIKNDDKSLIGVRIFAHGDEQIFKGDEIEKNVSFEAGHPVFFSSRNGHATYNREGENPTSADKIWGNNNLGVGKLGEFKYYLRNITNKGESIDLSRKYSLIAVDNDPSVVQPAWLEFRSAWGQINDDRDTAEAVVKPILVVLDGIAKVVKPLKKSWARDVDKAKEKLRKAVGQVLPGGPSGPKAKKSWDNDW